MVERENRYFIGENGISKVLISPKYKYRFNKENGTLLRWGVHMEDNPDMSEFGPEIADIEISTICNGINNAPCSFCYKGNNKDGKYMSLKKFIDIFHKLPRTLTQIAFGIGDIDGNPDLWEILKYCRSNDYNKVVPNITINGDRMKPEYYDKLVATCGAVAVSRYNLPDVCYNAVKELTNRGMEQVNIHALLSKETFESCIKIIDEAKTDPRLEKLNAIVFLAVKPKGRGYVLSPLTDTRKYREIVKKAEEAKIGIGFDSCSAPLFLMSMSGDENYEMFETLSEPCESSLFSTYINTDGIMYPCSFTEGDVEGIDMSTVEDFERDAWNHEITNKWRENLLSTASNQNCIVKGCRECPVYPQIYGKTNDREV